MEGSLPWSFAFRFPSCADQHERWGRGERPPHLQGHCGLTLEISYLTRTALYDVVWSEALSRLSQKYAISHVGLAEILSQGYRHLQQAASLALRDQADA